MIVVKNLTWIDVLTVYNAKLPLLNIPTVPQDWFKLTGIANKEKIYFLNNKKGEQRCLRILSEL